MKHPNIHIYTSGPMYMCQVCTRTGESSGYLLLWFEQLPRWNLDPVVLLKLVQYGLLAQLMMSDHFGANKGYFLSVAFHGKYDSYHTLTKVYYSVTIFAINVMHTLIGQCIVVIICFAHSPCRIVWSFTMYSWNHLLILFSSSQLDTLRLFGIQKTNQ